MKGVKALESVQRRLTKRLPDMEQEGQHPLTGQRAANFRLLATSKPNAGDHDFLLTGSNFGNLTVL